MINVELVYNKDFLMVSLSKSKPYPDDWEMKCALETLRSEIKWQ